MHVKNIWISPHGNNLVYISADVLKTLYKYVQRGPGSVESGGILLGYVRGPHIEILEATSPTFRDERYYSSFIRDTYFHADVAHEKWLKSSGKVRYLGEWHTHPEKYPQPSLLDIAEWRRLVKHRKDTRPLLGLIVGAEDFYLEYIYEDGTRIKFSHK